MYYLEKKWLCSGVKLTLRRELINFLILQSNLVITFRITDQIVWKEVAEKVRFGAKPYRNLSTVSIDYKMLFILNFIF
jgi:hypothetical protein